MFLFHDRYAVPTGMLDICVTDTAVAYLGFDLPEPRWGQYFGAIKPIAEAPNSAKDLMQKLCKQLDEYFNGSRRDFDLPLDVRGTEYRKRVWEALRLIPYGQTISYGELARRVGSAPRAVGQANHHNPISIIIPCHRVIGANGSLTGYGGGLEAKTLLLELEAKGTQAHGH